MGTTLVTAGAPAQLRNGPCLRRAGQIRSRRWSGVEPYLDHVLALLCPHVESRLCGDPPALAKGCLNHRQVARHRGRPTGSIRKPAANVACGGAAGQVARYSSPMYSLERDTQAAFVPNRKDTVMNATEMITIDATGWSVDSRVEARRLLDEIARREAAPAPTGGGWSAQSVMQALIELQGSRNTVQVKAIRRALENGGAVSRAEVYELGGYDSGRSLKGFTRPCNRITKHLKEQGLLPEDAQELLEPIYDPTAKGYSQAKSFRIPAGLPTVGLLEG